MNAATVGRKRRSESEWSVLGAAWQKSGQSQREFCRDHGLQPGSFQRWRQRLASSAATADFVTVVPTPSTPEARTPSWSLDLVLPNGCTLRFRG